MKKNQITRQMLIEAVAESTGDEAIVSAVEDPTVTRVARGASYIDGVPCAAALVYGESNEAEGVGAKIDGSLRRRMAEEDTDMDLFPVLEIVDV